MRLTAYTVGPPHSTSLTLRVALAASSTADSSVYNHVVLTVMAVQGRQGVLIDYRAVSCTTVKKQRNHTDELHASGFTVTSILSLYGFVFV